MDKKKSNKGRTKPGAALGVLLGSDSGGITREGDLIHVAVLHGRWSATAGVGSKGAKKMGSSHRSSTQIWGKKAQCRKQAGSSYL